MERVAARAGAALEERAHEARVGRGRLAGEPVVLLLPETWMNHSGVAVASALEAHPEVEPSRDLLVAFDDADLPLGRIRLRGSGGDGGHRGLANVLDHLGREDVPRLRLGIGRPQSPMPTRDFVLARFAEDEHVARDAALDRAVEAVACFVEEGTTVAMNRFNAPPPAPPAD